MKSKREETVYDKNAGSERQAPQLCASVPCLCWYPVYLFCESTQRTTLSLDTCTMVYMHIRLTRLLSQASNGGLVPGKTWLLILVEIHRTLILFLLQLYNLQLSMSFPVTFTADVLFLLFLSFDSLKRWFGREVLP